MTDELRESVAEALSPGFRKMSSRYQELTLRQVKPIVAAVREHYEAAIARLRQRLADEIPLVTEMAEMAATVAQLKQELQETEEQLTLYELREDSLCIEQDELNQELETAKAEIARLTRERDAAWDSALRKEESDA